jgi:hypothetical protein
MRFLLLVAATIALFFSRSVFSQGVQIEKAPAEGQSPVAAPPNATRQPPKSTPAPTPTAAEALYDYLQKYHIEVAKFQAGSRVLWTDRVLIEIPDRPVPEPLASLLAAAPGNTSQFSTWVHETFETQTQLWHPAKLNPRPSKQGTDEIVADTGNVRCFVNPVYVAYLLNRYPKASILMKEATDPVMFTVNGQLRAVLSRWTQLPDGTPL